MLYKNSCNSIIYPSSSIITDALVSSNSDFSLHFLSMTQRRIIELSLPLVLVLPQAVYSSNGALDSTPPQSAGQLGQYIGGYASTSQLEGPY